MFDAEITMIWCQENPHGLASRRTCSEEKPRLLRCAPGTVWSEEGIRFAPQEWGLNATMITTENQDWSKIIQDWTKINQDWAEPTTKEDLTKKLYIYINQFRLQKPMKYDLKPISNLHRDTRNMGKLREMDASPLFGIPKGRQKGRSLCIATPQRIHQPPKR